MTDRRDPPSDRDPAAPAPGSPGHPAAPRDPVPAADVRAPLQDGVRPAARVIGESVLTDGHNTQGNLMRPVDVLRRPGDAHRGDARGAPDISSANVGPGETESEPAPPGPLTKPARPDAVEE